MNFSDLAGNALSTARAKFNEKATKPDPIPESGIIVGFENGWAKVETPKGIFFAKSVSTGAGSIGQKVTLHITTQGTNFYNVLPR